MKHKIFSSVFLIKLLLVLYVTSLCINIHVTAARHKKYTSRELRELEEQWAADEDEEELELVDPNLRPTPELGTPPPPQEKQEIFFVVLEKSSEHAASKKATGDWAGKIADYLSTGGINIKGYSVEPQKALFLISSGMVHVMKAKQFLLEKDEVKELEWNQKTFTSDHKKAKSSK